MGTQRLLVCAAFALAAAAGESPRELNNLGARAFEEGRYEAAESYYRRALDQWKEPVEKAKTLGNLAVLCRRQGRFDEAETLYRSALDAFAEAHLSDSLPAATALANLAELHRARGRLPEAADAARKALEITERRAGAGGPANAGPR
jgi:tetratricopeptide (TPR) repeat protein